MSLNEENYSSSEELEELTNPEFYLKFSDTYIGSKEVTVTQMWIFDKENQKIVEQSVKYVPGLYRIIDEILVNAADNKQRDKNMDSIRVEVDVDLEDIDMRIKIWNNGKGLKIRSFDKKMRNSQRSIDDVDLTKPRTKPLIPTKAFASDNHTSTNFRNDLRKPRYTGGKNGVGAKLSNCFSKKFNVKIGSEEDGVIFEQQWQTNMKESKQPELQREKTTDFTEVEFYPDFKSFKFLDEEWSEISQNMVNIIYRRACDVAATTSTNVCFKYGLDNEEKIPISNFKDYIQLFAQNEDDVLYDKLNDLWEIGLLPSFKEEFQQISFVNSVETTGGGSHVKKVTDMIIKELSSALRKRNRKIKCNAIKENVIKKYCWVFINCLIDKPTFSNQIKERLTTRATTFGEDLKLSDEFIQKLPKSRIIKVIETQYRSNQPKIDEFFLKDKSKLELKDAQCAEEPGGSHTTLETDSHDGNAFGDQQEEEVSDSDDTNSIDEDQETDEQSGFDDTNNPNEVQENETIQLSIVSSKVQRKPRRMKRRKRPIPQVTLKVDSLSSIVDGLNCIQREVLKRCIGDKSEMSLDDLVRDIMATSSSSITEECCINAAISLGRTFTGSNNVNLLEVHCELDSKPVSADVNKIISKHTFIKLSQLTRLVFKADDDCIVNSELKCYIPVIPMILVNGVQDKIPNYDVLQIIENLLKRLAMDPSRRSFNDICSMKALDQDHKEKEYQSIDDILEEFYEFRLEMYELRKPSYINKLEDEIEKLDGKIVYLNELSNEGDLETTPCCGINITGKEIKKLEREKANKENNLTRLEQKSAADLWKQDLEELKTAYCEVKQIVQEDDEEVTENNRREYSNGGRESDSTEESSCEGPPIKRKKSVSDSCKPSTSSSPYST